MTLTNGKAPVTYPCTLKRQPGAVVLRSTQTGNRVAIMTDTLSTSDADFILGLIAEDVVSRSVSLPPAEMRRFKQIADAQFGTPAPSAPAVVPAPEPAKVETPAPAPVNGTSDPGAHSTLNVIGKSNALNGYDASLPLPAQGLGKATKIAEAIKSGLWQFTYDLPDYLSKSSKVLGDPWLRCPNPSHRCRIGGKARGKGWDFAGMWLVAARDQGSNWLITGKTTNDPRLAKLIAHWERVNATITKIVNKALADPGSTEAAWCKRVGLTRKLISAGKHLVKVRKLRVHEDEVERLYAEAKVSIGKEIERCRQSLADSLASADKALADLQADPTVDAKALDKGQRAHDSRYRGVLLQSAAAYYAAKDSADLFDATNDVQHLLDGLRNAIKAQRDFFNARANRTGKASSVTV